MPDPNSTYRVKCPGCGAILKVKAKSAGKIVNCPRCERRMQIGPPPKPKAPVATYGGSPGYYGSTTPSSYAAPPHHPHSYRKSSNSNSGLAYIIVPLIVVGILGLLAIPVGIFWSLGYFHNGGGGGNQSVAQAEASTVEPAGDVPPAVVPQEPAPKEPVVAESLPSDPTNGGGVAGANTNEESKLDLPPLPTPRADSETGAKVYDLKDVTSVRSRMRMRIYVPAGEHPNGSLPCVFVAPAGTPLLHGADIGEEDNMLEIAPFVRSGMAVACYSIDGGMPENGPQPGSSRYMARLSDAFKSFVQADSGVINGKHTIDRVLHSLPEVDRTKLYTTGHSSAATLSLLLAAKDRRISKCIACAPITDLNSRFDGILEQGGMERVLVGLRGYLSSGSPSTYSAQFRCPVWIGHAKDDDNVPFSESDRFVRQLRGQGVEVTFDSPESGGHYQEMLQAAIPKAIDWLKAN